jgi:hypothetical protein
LAKKARVYDGTAWQELASAQTDLTAYSTTAQMNAAIDAASGLTLIKTQTIGTAVASVTVTDAFSATYDSYKIVVSGGVASTLTSIRTTLGASVASYYSQTQASQFAATTAVLFANNNVAHFGATGSGDANVLSCNFDLLQPFLTKYTILNNASYVSLNEAGITQGVHRVSASYTDFTLTATSGTLTGGTIYVYGYAKV